jgi:hypothetical protein
VYACRVFDRLKYAWCVYAAKNNYLSSMSPFSLQPFYTANRFVPGPSECKALFVILLHSASFMYFNGLVCRSFARHVR